MIAHAWNSHRHRPLCRSDLLCLLQRHSPGHHTHVPLYPGMTPGGSCQLQIPGGKKQQQQQNVLLLISSKIYVCTRLASKASNTSHLLNALRGPTAASINQVLSREGRESFLSGSCQQQTDLLLPEPLLLGPGPASEGQHFHTTLLAGHPLV